MRLVLAARLSQLAEGQTGLDTQDEDARAWAAAHGHTIVAAAPDRISGRVSPFDRPKLGPWLTEPNRIALYDGILVSKIDRLTRKDDWDIRQWAEDNGKKIIVVSPELEWPPPSGEAGTATRMIWDSLMNLARGEWENTSTRYRRMQRALRDQAFFVGKPPYGYRIVQVDGTDHKTLEPDLVTSAIVRGMAHRYLNGESLRQICDWLTASAIPAPQPPKERAGKGWTPQAVRRILRNQAIIGRVQTNGRTVLRTEALISNEDYRRIADLMESRAHRGARGNTALLTSIVFCSDGHAMYRIQGRKIPSVPDGLYYYCRECPKGERLHVPMTEVDEAVNEAVMSKADQPHFVTDITPGDDWAEEIQRVRDDIRDLDPEADGYDTQLAVLRGELTRLRALPAKPAEITRKRDGNRTISEVWEALDTAGKRQKLLAERIKVVPVRHADGHVSVVIGPADDTLEGNSLYGMIEALGGPAWPDLFADFVAPNRRRR
jgi:site-specific DNA recombinase